MLSISLTELRRYVGEMRSYLVDFVFMSLNDIFMIVGLIAGVVGRESDMARLHQVIIGLLVWRISASAIQSMSALLQSELRLGTFEQLLLSKTPVTQVILIRLAVNIVIECAVFMVLCVVGLLALGKPWTSALVRPAEAVGILIGSVGFVGLGMLFCGWTLRFKRATSVARFASNLILFFSGLLFPLSSVSAGLELGARFFPFVWLQEWLQEGSSRLTFPWLLVLTSSAWFVLGSWSYAANLASQRRRGSTSHP